MSHSESCDREMPSHVRSAASLTLFLSLYAGAMSVPICLVGSFAGPHILVPGVIHAAMAAVLFFSWRGLTRRRRWARSLVVALSACAAIALITVIVYSSTVGPIDPVGAIFFLAVSLLFALNLWTLSTKSAILWFANG